MDLVKYISVLVVFFIGGGDTDGHGEKHHDHVKLHVPEFIHHDHHTKVITIHHHHHKPKEKHHHHHHHHHHPKPYIPHGHHYHKHHKKTHTKTQTKTSGHGHGHSHSHGHHGHHGKHGHHGHQGHHGHHGSHGHHGQGQGHKHHDPPSFSYDPNPVTFEDDYKSFTPSVPAIPSVPSSIPQTPQVHGIVHTVNQVKVYDSLPGALPGKTGSHGYEVTEVGEHSDDDVFTAINTLPQTYPGTYGFVRGAADQPADDDIFSEFPVQSTVQANHDPFAAAPQPTAYADVETFSSNGQSDPYSSVAPTYGALPSVPTSQFPDGQPTGFDDPGNAYPADDISSTALLSTDDRLNEDTPVSFSREAGIQHTYKTGGVETLEY